MTQHVRNILKVYRRATTEDIANGYKWYDEAKTYCSIISGLSGVKLNTVIGVMAALSPNNKWERNKVDAFNVIQAWREGLTPDHVKCCTYVLGLGQR